MARRSLQLAVFSDSHGGPLLRQAVASARARGATCFVHLGDNYEDLSEIDCGGGAILYRVPGLQCPERHNPFVDRIARFDFAGYRFIAVHDLSDCPAASGQTEIVLYGHTHIAAVAREGSRWYVNPGHLKAARDRGQPAGFAVFVVLPAGGLRVEFCEPGGRKRQTETIKPI